MAGFDNTLIDIVSGQILDTWSDEALAINIASLDEMGLDAGIKAGIIANLTANPIKDKEAVRVQVRSHVDKIFQAIEDQFLNHSKVVLNQVVVTGGTVIGTTFTPEYGIVTGAISFQ